MLSYQTTRVPIVSIVVPFLGLPFRILNIKLAKPKQGTTMEAIGNSCPTQKPYFLLGRCLVPGETNTAYRFAVPPAPWHLAHRVRGYMNLTRSYNGENSIACDEGL